MEKGLFKKLTLLLTYVIILVAVIVKIDAVGGWVRGVIKAFEPFYIGFAIAFVLNRPCNFFARLYGRKLKGKWEKTARPFAVATAYVLLFAVVTALFAIVIPELVESITSFIGNLNIYATNLQEFYDFMVEKFGLELLGDMDLTTIINENLSKLLSGVLAALTTTIPQLITTAGAVVGAVATTLLAFVFSVYMLAGAPRLMDQLRRLTRHYLPENTANVVLSVARITADTFTGYVSGQVIEAGIIGVLCFLGMCIFGFDYAILISMIIAVTALVPIVGAYVGAIVAALLLLMIEPMQAVWFVVFLVILQQLETNLIYPRVVGTSIGLPGIWVLTAVTVGGSLLGFAGLIIGVPVTAVLYTLLKCNLHKREEKDIRPKGRKKS